MGRANDAGSWTTEQTCLLEKYTSCLICTQAPHQTSMKFLSLSLAALACMACTAPRPTDIPVTEQALIVIKTVRLPDSEPWYSQFAQHSWIDFRPAEQAQWVRIEANTDPKIEPISDKEARQATRWGRDVSLLLMLRGDAAAAVLVDLQREAERIIVGFEYQAFPGPNSNTYISRVLRAVPGLSAQLDHNSVGKDYTPIVSTGLTTANDGVYLDTVVLGASAGYLSGVELHLLGLTLGLGFWPPGIKIPVLPRIGPALGPRY